MASTLPPGELFALDALVTPTAQGIASPVLARTAAGNITLFAFDVKQEVLRNCVKSGRDCDEPRANRLPGVVSIATAASL